MPLNLTVAFSMPGMFWKANPVLKAWKVMEFSVDGLDFCRRYKNFAR